MNPYTSNFLKTSWRKKNPIVSYYCILFKFPESQENLFFAGRKILELGGNNAIIGELHISQYSFVLHHNEINPIWIASAPMWSKRYAKIGSHFHYFSAAYSLSVNNLYYCILVKSLPLQVCTVFLSAKCPRGMSFPHSLMIKAQCAYLSPYIS